MERVFVDEYVITKNAMQSALTAQYAYSTAQKQSYKWVGIDRNKCPDNKKHVWDAVKTATSAASKRCRVTQDFVIKGLVEIAQRCSQKSPLMEGDVQAVDDSGNLLWENSADDVFNPAAATRSFELLGKTMRMFVDRGELSGPDGGPIETKGTNNDATMQTINQLMKVVAGNK